jgi:hypothetical protein
MTPDTLSKLNDLRMRVVQADEAERAGDHERARALMPSDTEIIEALKLARADRAAATAKKSAAALTKAEADKFKTMDLNELFGGP